MQGYVWFLLTVMQDGLALCALIHSVEGKEGKEYEAFVTLPAAAVLDGTFQLADKLGIPPLLRMLLLLLLLLLFHAYTKSIWNNRKCLEPSDLLDNVPNRTLVESYLQFVYQHWQQHQHNLSNNKNQQQKDNSESKEQVEPEVEQDVALLPEHVGKVLRESKEIKGKIINTLRFVFTFADIWPFRNVGFCWSRAYKNTSKHRATWQT